MQAVVTRSNSTPYIKLIGEYLLALLKHATPSVRSSVAPFASGGTRTESENRDEEETQPISSTQPAVPKEKAIQILVVEDEGIVALDIKMTLRRMGHHVIATVDSGNDAIRLATTQQPDLILMDIRLKGDIDGVEATQSIRQQYNIPVIYLTGQLDEITVKRAQATNPAGYLAKPFTASELAILIQNVLKR